LLVLLMKDELFPDFVAPVWATVEDGAVEVDVPQQLWEDYQRVRAAYLAAGSEIDNLYEDAYSRHVQEQRELRRLRRDSEQASVSSIGFGNGAGIQATPEFHWENTTINVPTRPRA
jgi:hypothetical protein